MPMHLCDKCETWILSGEEHECKNDKPFNVIMTTDDIENLKKNHTESKEE